LVNPPFDAVVRDDDEVAFLPMAAVSEERADVMPQSVRTFGQVKAGYTYFRNGDVLVAKITPCFENGKIAVAHLTHRHGFGSTEFHVIRAVEERLDRRYLVHFLRRERIRIEGERRMTGSAGQRRVPKSFIEGVEIPLQPLAEQRRIAAILDAADALRQKR